MSKDKKRFFGNNDEKSESTETPVVEEKVEETIVEPEVEKKVAVKASKKETRVRLVRDGADKWGNPNFVEEEY